ncbi:MAG: helix-turn-helix transcriptional regulator [Bacteroidales bacterium]|nr:helix-turn-helix transcriptional regulator [Bacteroidales bacterium]
MNYNKIKEEVEKRFPSHIEFCRKIGMPKSTFDRIFNEQNTRISTLEMISDGLGVSPSYWWEDEEAQLTMVKEGAIHYGGYIPRSVYLDMLGKWNEDRESKKKLEEHIDFLQKHFDDHKRKSAQCG